MDVDFAANREYYSDSEHIVPALEDNELPVVDTDDFSVPNVENGANEQMIEAVCRLKVSRMERDELFPFFELVDMARDHPGVVERAIMEEAATRARLALQPSFHDLARPRQDEMDRHKQELLDRAYELVFPGRDANDEINARKLFAIDYKMQLRIPDEYAWVDDESATENDINSSDLDS